MSNPGVLILVQKQINESKQFRVEDNLGESIHFHYNDIRIDLTIKELLCLSSICDYTIYDMVNVKDFDLDDYDDEFLNSCSEKLLDLKSVEKINYKANQLFYIKASSKGIPSRKHICPEKIELTPDENVFLPVVFNDDNVIQYGVNQVKKALADDPNVEIPIIRLRFDNSKYSAPRYPVRDYFFKWNQKRLKKCVKKIARKIFR